MNKLERPERPRDSSSSKGSWVPVGVAGVALAGGAAVLCLLPLGMLGYAIVIGGGLFLGMIAFHYFVWGYWLTRMLEKERQAEEQRESASSD